MKLRTKQSARQHLIASVNLNSKKLQSITIDYNVVETGTNEHIRMQMYILDLFYIV